MTTASTNKQPIFPVTPILGSCSITAANTGRTVTGVTGLTQLGTVGTDGQRVDAIRIVSNGAIGSATSANVLRVWYYTGSGNAVLFDEIAIGSTTPSATAIGYVNTVYYSTVTPPAGSTIYVSLHTYAGAQDGYNVFLHGGNY